MDINYDDEQLAKHGCTRKDVDLVMRSEVWSDLGISKNGNDRIMFVGFAEDGRLLEVGVEYFDEQDLEWVFHANIATLKYRRLFKERMKL